MFQGCPKGTFKPLIGPRTCTPCPEYSTSMDGSTSPEHCVCQHGEFQIMSDQERKCQRYENEELVRLGKETVFYGRYTLSVIGILICYIQLLIHSYKRSFNYRKILSEKYTLT